MSVEIFINTLSANSQFRSIQEAQAALKALVSCFQLIQPGLYAGTIAIAYDDNMERRALIHGNASIASCLASLDRDLRQRWYLFTRRARRANSTFLKYSLVGGGETISGEASHDYIGSEILAGFGGSPACTEAVVDIADDSGRQTKCQSTYEPAGLGRLLPRYEANQKHRSTPYWSHGEYVSPMTVGPAEAQNALFAAIGDGGGHYYGVHKAKLLKFVLTGSYDGPIYHAFEVEKGDVPPQILAELSAR